MTPVWNDFFPPEVAVYISDRSQDFTLPKQLTQIPYSQKQELARTLDFSVENLFTVRQVHGKRIVTIDGRFPSLSASLEEADGIITNVPKIPISIRTADCVPVFLYDRRHGCLGLVHAGWRGTYEKIVREAVQAMKQLSSSEPSEIQALIGPCIRSCCYQVSEDFWGYFEDDMTRREEGSYLDLSAANIRQLRAEGVLLKNILDAKLCTCCDLRWHSYRRDGEKSGRMISVMMLRNDMAAVAAPTSVEHEGGR